MELTKIKERPIIFSGEMVRAYLEGHKTQTRRVLRVQPTGDPSSLHLGAWDIYQNIYMFLDKSGPIYPEFKCPYGIPGDRLYVKETFTIETWGAEFGQPNLPKDRPTRFHKAENDYDENYWELPHYRATDPTPELIYEDDPKQGDEPRCKWISSRFMPKWVARIKLEILKIRLERLQHMNNIDAFAEGTPDLRTIENDWDLRDCFHQLWDSLNAKRGFGWDTNPWVWVIEFPKRPNELEEYRKRMSPDEFKRLNQNEWPTK